jgi:hypothetical protein
MRSNADSGYVLYIKPRNEKKVAERFFGAGYTVYCPLQKACHLWSYGVRVDAFSTLFS